MAKGGKKAKGPGAAPTGGRSVLRAAWDRLEAGDAVEARRLALAALGGARGVDDEAAAVELAAAMQGTPGLKIDPTVPSVAQALAARTLAPPRSFLFAAVSLGILGLLVALAVTRYAS
jgi:hypothetical protein